MIVVKKKRGLVWIASYPKSGNTWVRVYLYHLMRIAGGHPRAENDLNEIDRASGYEARFVGLFEEFMGKSLANASRQEVAAVRPRVHEEVAKRSPSYALLKTHNLLGKIAGHQVINLDVSVGSIYIVRDPRDVVISLADHHATTIDDTIHIMEQSAHTTSNRDEAVFEVWGNWSENVKGWTMLADEAALVVRYEDLLADPFEQFSAITAHLRQKPSAEQIREAISLSTFKELARQEATDGFRERSRNSEKFFRVGTSGQWKEALSAVQAARIEDIHAEQMKKFGYL